MTWQDILAPFQLIIFNVRMVNDLECQDSDFQVLCTCNNIAQNNSFCMIYMVIQSELPSSMSFFPWSFSKLQFQKVQRDIADHDVRKWWALKVTVLRSHSPLLPDSSKKIYVLSCFWYTLNGSLQIVWSKHTKLQCWLVWISLSVMWCKSSFISITSTARRSDQPHSMLSYKRHYCLLLVFNTWQM